MADNASFELALERAVEDTLAAGGKAWFVLAPLPHARRVFQDAGAADAARLLDEMSPPASDPAADDDERVLMVIVRAPGAEEDTVLGAAVMGPPRFGGGNGDDGGAYRGGGFGALPASAAAVAELKKAAFRAAGGGDGAAAKKGRCCGGGVTGCAVCLEEFEDGEEVTEMPCGRGHGFHPGCITEWLGCSNMCPLCRHPLPTSCVDGQ